MNSAWKVGLLTLVALALGAFLVLRIEDVHLFRDKPRVFFVQLSSADGLELKAPVRFKGVKIGSVKDIALNEKGVRLKLEIESAVHFSEGTYAVVESLGFLGERHLELHPESAKGPLLPEGTEIPGKTSADWSDALAWADAIGDDVSAVTKNLRHSLGDEKGQERMEEMVNSLVQVTSLLAEIVEQNQDNVNVSLAHLRHTSEKMAEASERLSSILTKVDSGEGSVGQWVSKPETADRLNQSLASVQKGVESINQVLGRVTDTRIDMGLRAEYLADSNRGKGYFNIDIVPPKSQRFYRLEAVSQPFGLREEATTKTTTMLDGAPVVTQTETKERFVNQWAFSAQVAQRLGPFVLRGGILESTGGAGADVWLLNQRLRLTAEAWDFNRNGPNWHAKLHAGFYPSPNIYLVAGWDDLLNRSLKLDSVFFGLGARWDADDIKYLLPSIPGF